MIQPAKSLRFRKVSGGKREQMPLGAHTLDIGSNPILATDKNKAGKNKLPS